MLSEILLQTKKMKNKFTEKSEFDHYAGQYKNLINQSLPKFLKDADYYTRYKVEHVFNHRQNLSTKFILDFGCGVGLSLQAFSEYFPNSELWGYDVSSVSIKYAKKQINKTIFESNLDNIPKNCFDVIFIANVFHHMSNQDQKNTILNCRNFLNQDGCIYFFEHNPFNPLTRKIFNNSPLDKNAKMIYIKNIVSLAQTTGMKVVSKKYTLFFPKQLSFLKFVEKFISWIPIGAQYYIILKK